jgi:hypothetical protein
MAAQAVLINDDLDSRGENRMFFNISDRSDGFGDDRAGDRSAGRSDPYVPSPAGDRGGNGKKALEGCDHLVQFEEPVSWSHRTLPHNRRVTCGLPAGHIRAARRTLQTQLNAPLKSCTNRGRDRCTADDVRIGWVFS